MSTQEAVQGRPILAQPLSAVVVSGAAAATSTPPASLPSCSPTHAPASLCAAAAAAERLLQEGASPWNKDCNQRLPLHFSSEAGHVACVRLLVAEMRRSGRDPQTGALPPLDLKDQNQQTPVQLAAEHGHPDCAALLLDADGTGEGGM